MSSKNQENSLNKNEDQANQMSLTAHFVELRNRLIFSLIFFCLSFGISYFFAKEIYQFLLGPFVEAAGGNSGHRLIYTSPAEAFITYIKLAFYCALFVSLPIFFAEIYLFIAPGLYKHEKRNVAAIFFGTSFLFFLGGIFAFALVLPAALKFFLSFEVVRLGGDVLPVSLETRISDYLSFVLSLIFGFGIAFILPVFLLILVKMKLISVDSLRRKRRYIIVFIFAISAILTPPDILSQIALALALMLLFELVILIGR